MNRLRAFRDIEGINQHELGYMLGISPQMVSAIESGRREFAGDLRLIGYAPDRMALPDMSTPLHRQRASTKAAAKKRAKELLRLAGEVFGDLRARTDRAPQLMLDRHPTPTSLEDIEELAVESRCSLDHEETGPIQNLTASIERAGVCLVPIVGLPGVDGLSAWVNGVPVIGLSPAVPGDRFRLSLGHELAHLLFHARKSDTTEGEANRFAGALLFPQAEFDAAMPDRPKLSHFIALKASWGMAVSAIVYRAHELEYIDDARYRALQIQMSKWRRSEPGTFEPKHGRLFARMVEIHGGAVNVASELGVNPQHLSELLNWSHLRIA
jgi:Zn-dependent peptidase ImmA (M78 family)/transcriptional regulator with XRE-family HTH domain